MPFCMTTQIEKFRGANMGPTWVLSAPDGPHVGPMNLAIREVNIGLLNQYGHDDLKYGSSYIELTGY